MLIAQLAQALQKLWRRSRHTALALDRLNHHRTGVIIHHRFHCVEIVKGNVDDVCRFWPKAVGIFWLGDHRDGKQRATMKSVMEGNNFGFERAMTHTGIMACQFKGGFVSFRAGVHKHHAFGKRRLNQFAPKTQRRFIGENVTDMPQSFALGF